MTSFWGGFFLLIIFSPAYFYEPCFPCVAVGLLLFLYFFGQVGAGRWDRAQRAEADGGAQIVDAIRVFELEWAGQAVADIVDPLGSVALGAAFVDGDAVFKISGLPGGEFCFCCVALEQL